MKRCEAAGPSSFPHAFLEGLSAPWAGLRLMNDNPSLWRYGVLPVAVNLAITALLLAALFGGGVYLFPAFP